MVKTEFLAYLRLRRPSVTWFESAIASVTVTLRHLEMERDTLEQARQEIYPKTVTVPDANGYGPSR